ISIVTHNSSHIFEVLDHLLPIIKEDYQVVIYDNASETDYRERLKSYQNDQVSLIFSQENNGFGFGHNHILKQAQARYAIVFNPDILVGKDTLPEMIKLLKQHPTAAAAMPKVLNQDGTKQYLVRKRLTVFDYFLRFIPLKYEKRLA